MRILILVLLVACVAVPAQAQVVNPTTVLFTASVDHDRLDEAGQPVLTRYELRLYFAGASDPFALYDLGKPVPVAGEISVVNAAWFVGVANGTLCVARVAAVGPSGVSVSEVSNTWTRAPVAPPSKGVVGLDPWASG